MTHLPNPNPAELATVLSPDQADVGDERYRDDVTITPGPASRIVATIPVQNGFTVTVTRYEGRTAGEWYGVSDAYRSAYFATMADAMTYAFRSTGWGLTVIDTYTDAGEFESVNRRPNPEQVTS
jgi:hypothetical protein